MIMFPEPTILAEIDLTTSKSEKPEGATTNALEVKMPALISRLSYLRIYAFEALNRSGRAILMIQAAKVTRPVHRIIGIIRFV
jgi:hypothetical protein